MSDKEEPNRPDAYFRLLIESAQDILAVLDAAGIFQYCSPSIEAQLGYLPETVLGKAVIEWIHPDETEAFRQQIESVGHQPGQPFQSVYRLRHQKGSWSYFECAITNRLGVAGIQGLVMVLNDITERIGVEEELSRREKYFRSLLESSFDVVFTRSEDGLINYISPSVETVLGYQPEELLGQLGLQIFCEEDLDSIIRDGLELLPMPGASQFRELHLRRKDGRIICVESIARNMLNEESIRGFVINFRDITAQKETENLIRKSEEYYRSLIENSHDIIAILGRNAVVKYFSPAIEKNFGFPPEEIMGQNAFDYVHPDDKAEIKEKFAKTSQTPNYISRSIFRFRHKNGSWRYIETVAKNLVDSESVDGIVVNFRDITEAREAQEKLRLSEKHFRSLIENSNDILSICDEQVNFFYVSPSVERMLGYSPDEYIRLNGRGLTHPDYEEVTRNTFLQAMAQPGIPVSAEFKFKRKDGSWIFLETIFHNLLHDEAVRGVVMVSRDIEDRKQTEELLKNYNEKLEQAVNRQTRELQHKNQELQRLLHDLRNTQSQLVDSEKMASLGQLTAGIAHEINNPINFISSNISPLKRDIESLKEIIRAYEETNGEGNGQEKTRKIQQLKQEMEYDYVLDEINLLLVGMKEGADRTAEIVKGLQSFSRVDENTLKVVQVHGGIESTLMLLKNKLRERITVHKLYGELPEIECYPGKLNQVFMNILVNAIQAIAGTGEITIQTQRKGDHIVLSFRDTGVGMKEEVRKRVFEPFFTTKRVGEGTGLGLSISYGIIEKHHGTIDVRSKPGKGSEFIVTLPIIQPP